MEIGSCFEPLLVHMARDAGFVIVFSGPPDALSLLRDNLASAELGLTIVSMIPTITQGAPPPLPGMPLPGEVP